MLKPLASKYDQKFAEPSKFSLIRKWFKCRFFEGTKVLILFRNFRLYCPLIILTLTDNGLFRPIYINHTENMQLLNVLVDCHKSCF